MEISFTTKIKVSIKRFIQNIKGKIKKEKKQKEETRPLEPDYKRVFKQKKDRPQVNGPRADPKKAVVPGGQGIRPREEVITDSDDEPLAKKFRKDLQPQPASPDYSPSSAEEPSKEKSPGPQKQKRPVTRSESPKVRRKLNEKHNEQFHSIYKDWLSLLY